MSKLKIKNLILDQFKGSSHSEYEFGDMAEVLGENGSGKTTIGDGIYWLFTDKDYSLKSNPDVRPENREESEPSVTALCVIDGKDVELRKFQKDRRTKKQKEAGAPVSITNQFEINGVPKSQKDFVAYLEENGIEMDKFLLLSHPEIFADQKSADCRRILFGMVSDITDKEIADSMDDCGELSELLAHYKIDEIVALKKRQQKEAEQNLDAIPEQIIGMEKSKVDIDISEYVAQRDTLQAEIAELEEKITNYRKESPDDLNKQLGLLKQEYDAMVAQANSERVAKLTEANAVIGNKRVELNGMMSAQESSRKELAELISVGNSMASEYKHLAEEYQQWKSEEFDPSDEKCPYCGQDLPVHEIDKAHKAFEEKKASEMHRINERAKDVKNKFNASKKRISEIQAEISERDQKINALREETEQLSANRVQLESVITVDGTPEGQDVLSRIAEVTHKLNKRDEYSEQECSMLAVLRDKKSAISELDETIGSVKVNDRIDAKIAELREQQKRESRASADARKILDQIAKVSMEKNRRLTDEVNSHFEIVRFKLFDQQKNGEYKDCCIPTIRNDDGVYRTFGSSANTALEVRGKLDIISGLQKFYGMYVPVTLDGAECLDETNKKQIHMDTQLIMLSVSNDKELRVENVKRDS